LSPDSISGAPESPDLIRSENERPGTLDWQLTYTRIDPKTKWRSTLIEGFAGRQCVQAGDKLELFVSTDPATPFTIDIYRLGYYQWPDNYSLYTNDRPDKKPLVSGVKVSFDRPYGKYVQIFDNPLSQGSGEFLLWEFPLAYWMEQHGYDVSYCSNSDVAADP